MKSLLNTLKTLAASVIKAITSKINAGFEVTEIETVAPKMELAVVSKMEVVPVPKMELAVVPKMELMVIPEVIAEEAVDEEVKLDKYDYGYEDDFGPWKGDVTTYPYYDSFLECWIDENGDEVEVEEAKDEDEWTDEDYQKELEEEMYAIQYGDSDREPWADSKSISYPYYDSFLECWVDENGDEVEVEPVHEEDEWTDEDYDKWFEEEVYYLNHCDVDYGQLKDEVLTYPKYCPFLECWVDENGDEVDEPTQTV